MQVCHRLGHSLNVFREGEERRGGREAEREKKESGGEKREKKKQSRAWQQRSVRFLDTSGQMATFL